MVLSVVVVDDVNLMFPHQDVASLPSSVMQGACLFGFCHPNHRQLKRRLDAELGEDIRRFLALCQCKASYLLESNARLGYTSDLKLLNSSLLTLKMPFRVAPWAQCVLLLNTALIIYLPLACSDFESSDFVSIR